MMEEERKEESKSPMNAFSRFKKTQETTNISSKPPLTKVDRNSEIRRANEAAKALAKQPKNVLSYEEERKQAKLNKNKMDDIKKKYTRISRSGSRKRSNSKGAKSCITNINQRPPISEINAQNNVQKSNIVRDTRTEVSHGVQQRAKFRKISPDDTTKCTREEDINIDQFLMDDLAYINKEETKLQQEILIEHKNSINKVKEIEMRHKIDTKMISAKQMVKQLNGIDPYETMKKFDYNNETEEQIEESLENLNFLLAQNSK